MQLASKYIKVILDGQGADELFAGYPYYKEYSLNNLFHLQNLIKGIRRKCFLFAPDAIRKSSFFTLYQGKIKKAEECLKNRMNLDFVFHVLKESTPRNLNQALCLDETKYNLQQLLKYEDRNAMRFGIESRVPFTDYRLVEYVLNIPACYKIRNGWTKYILRKAAETLLPKETVWRRDKIAFETPEKKWLQDDPNFKNFLFLKNINNYNGDRFWWRLYNFFLLDS
jgi:asparagine synthase (glutamine-hydrolysing)